MNRASRVLSIAFLAGMGCSEPAPAMLRQSILGGDATARGAWPSLAWLDNGCTGVLVTPSVVLSAGHCGEATRAWFGDALEVVLEDERAPVASSSNATAVALQRCRVHPESGLGLGTDVAVCVLSEPMAEARFIAPIALGCARQQVRPGIELTVVGFGVSGTEGESLGTKRSATTEVAAIGRELVAGDDERGACAGDSGGPAFVSLLAHDQKPEWALVGVLSSGVEGTTCGTGYYTDLSQVSAWLEEAIATDVSPCFEGAAWRPNERCAKAMLDAEGLPLAEPAELSQLCGSAYRDEPSAGCAFAPPFARRGASSSVCAMLALAMTAVWTTRKRMSTTTT